MDMKKLVCDVCGGAIRMQEGGQFGICSCCGLEYTVERMREIYSGMKVSVTGSEDDVAQWKNLLHKYMLKMDYKSAMGVVRKILEADPSDEESNNIYDELLELDNFSIQGKTLIKYTGTAERICVPEGVEILNKHSLCGYEIILPTTLKIIRELAIVIKGGETLIVPDNVEVIENDAIWDSVGKLKYIRLPQEFTGGWECIRHCNGLETLEASETIKNTIGRMGNQQDYDNLFPVGSSPFAKNHPIAVAERRRNQQMRKQRIEWERIGRCPNCGGTFSLWSGKCKNCGQRKLPGYFI